MPLQKGWSICRVLSGRASLQRATWILRWPVSPDALTRLMIQLALSQPQAVRQQDWFRTTPQALNVQAVQKNFCQSRQRLATYQRCVTSCGVCLPAALAVCLSRAHREENRMHADCVDLCLEAGLRMHWGPLPLSAVTIALPHMCVVFVMCS